MVFFNWATMQMAAKIVYYGPGLCGKTSNLSYIYAKTAPGSRGEMVSLETESDRTLFFDLLPIEVGTIGGFKTRLQLYTVPGQVFYNTTRKLVLKGVDGLVFVADSQRPMRDANMESFATLKDNLKEFGLSLSDLPIVLQYNKRDLSNILSVDELNADLNPEREFLFCEASAVSGDGVITTLKEITKLTLKKLRTRMNAGDATTVGGPKGGAADGASGEAATAGITDFGKIAGSRRRGRSRRRSGQTRPENRCKRTGGCPGAKARGHIRRNRGKSGSRRRIRGVSGRNGTSRSGRTGRRVDSTGRGGRPIPSARARGACR